MLTFRVTHDGDEERVVDALGVIPAGQAVDFTEDQAEWFQRIRGVPLIHGNLPEGVDLTIVVTDEGKAVED